MGIFKNLKRKDDNAIRVCPKCHRPTLKHAHNLSGFMLPDKFECTSPGCHYVGVIYLEISPEELEEMQAAEEKPSENTTTAEDIPYSENGEESN